MDEDEFYELVEKAYESLPQHVRDMEDLPGIVVLDEPDASDLASHPVGTEMLGCFRGVRKSQMSHNVVRIVPDLIVVFRGPVLRCGGDIQESVKRIVWHEVAHYLGYDEQGVTELGLQWTKS